MGTFYLVLVLAIVTTALILAVIALVGTLTDPSKADGLGIIEDEDYQ
jgi:hypothetical protein